MSCLLRKELGKPSGMLLVVCIKRLFVLISSTDVSNPAFPEFYMRVRHGLRLAYKRFTTTELMTAVCTTSLDLSQKAKG